MANCVTKIERGKKKPSYFWTTGTMAYDYTLLYIIFVEYTITY